MGSVLEQLEAGPLDGYTLGEGTTNDPEFLLVPRTVNALFDRISSVIRQARKTPDELIRIDLPPAVRAVLEKDEPSPANRLHLGDEPDRARLDAAAVGAFLQQVRPGGLIVENLPAAKVEKLAATTRGVPLVVALPAVFFEADIRPLRALLAACARAKLPVEVNSWGGWHLGQGGRGADGGRAGDGGAQLAGRPRAGPARPAVGDDLRRGRPPANGGHRGPLSSRPAR